MKHLAKKLSAKLPKTNFLTASRFSRINLAVFVLIFASIGGYIIYSSFAASSAPPAIHISGNKIVDSNNNVVAMRGTMETSSSYACEQNGGYGFYDYGGLTGDAVFSPMVNWHINSSELLLNQDCWLGINGVPAAYSGQNYINFVKAQVTSMEKYGIYPVLVFGEGSPGTETPNYFATDAGEEQMPNSDHFPLLFEELASEFKSDPDVMFKLYEEPYPNYSTDLSTWKCWSQGDLQYSTSSVSSLPVGWESSPGTQTTPMQTASTRHCNLTSQNGHAFTAVGMQSLINIVRGTGATNIIQVPGVDFANGLSCTSSSSPTSCGFLDSADGVRVNDTLNPAQLMANTDNYPGNGQFCDNLSCVTTTYDPVAAVMPIDMGEIGPELSSPYSYSVAEQFINHYDSLSQSYYGSQWETWSGFVDNYSTGAPGAGWGQWFHDHIVSLSNPAPSVTLTANPTSITSGNSSTLTWSSASATSCSATSPSGWTSSTATSGSQSVSPTSTTTYTITCTGAGGSTPASATVTVGTADITPPSVPGGLASPSKSTTSIDLSWNASTDPTVSGAITSGLAGYKIYRNGSGTPLTTTNQLSYTDSGLTPNTTYTYQVTAYDNTGNESAKSTSLNATTSAPGSGALDHNLGSSSWNPNQSAATNESFTTTTAASSSTRVVVTVSYWTLSGKVSSVNVGGSSAHLDKQTINSNGNDVYEIWSIPEPSGLTSGSTIVINFPSGQIGGILSGAMSIGGVDLTNGAGIAATASATGSGTSWVSGTVSTSGAIVVGGAGNETTGSTTATVTTGTKVHDVWQSGAGQGFTDGYNIGGTSIAGTFSTSSATTTGAAVAYSPTSGTAPTATLTPNPTTINSGSSSTLTWSSTNATSCSATSPSGWTSKTTTNDSQSVSPTTTTTYTITCTGTGGSTPANATVTVSGSTVTGDLNGDGHVNVFDLSIFLTHWQQSGTGLPEDFNNDNIVNIFDLSILLSHYGT